MTHEILIDASTANRLINEVVTPDKEDFVYAPSNPHDRSSNLCVYVRGDEPSCLIGQALFKIGMTIEELSWLDQCEVASISVVNLPDRFYFDDGARYIFDAAQRAQDDGYTWGEAKKRANAVYDSLMKEYGFND